MIQGPYTDPSVYYQYEYHSEANLQKPNPTFINEGYGFPKPIARKEVTAAFLRVSALHT